ncbi:protein windpipe [Aricia agestis]|uniref:protein windpipe n=1 Tax=Aricia agestis TaxID=91739 RepID=UPI001C209DFD|nr:protein windpipe [Aricia agestis]
MAWLQTKIFFFVTSLLLAPTLASICPDKCICSTTRDSLHRATCSSLPDLYKYTLRQKHHNINILDLSHNNITKITHELDRLTEVVTLDLSTNGLTDINKFLHNAKKLVHLNLAHNRIQSMSLLHLPTSISSLDLTNNLMKNVPSDVNHLASLEHLELAGNPLECSCENIIARDHLIANGVFIDHVKCSGPANLKGKSWLELKTKELCKVPTFDMDMMMGDQPFDAVQIGEETTALRSMPLTANTDLEDGKVISDTAHENDNDDDDNVQFMKVGHYSSPSRTHEIEGSGEAESTTMIDIIEPIEERKMYNNLMMSEDMLPVNNVKTTEDPDEGSGEGSGFGYIDFNHETDKGIITTTPVVEDFFPPTIPNVFEEDSENDTGMDFPMHTPPTIYQGGSDWHKKVVTEEPTLSTMKAVTLEATRDTTVSEQIRITQPSEVLDQASRNEENGPTHKTGTYVCIALIVVLLVGLIGFAITKSQMRKRRDRRLLRHQKRDVEKASKEMVDMNKSLLGKPAVAETPNEKITNGKYELVPTHEVHQKKDKNGDLSHGKKYDESNGLRTDSPRDTNQNKNSSKDNNLTPDVLPPQETSFDSDVVAPTSRKDTNTNSISSDEYFVPINDDDATRINGNLESDTSQPLINGDPDYLSPSREYVPVYSPDMGRVRIKMTETPKPKTPVLVTRSRSNAGDIIITPSLDNNAIKSTT